MGIVNKSQGQTFNVLWEPGQFIILRPLTWQEVTEARAVASKARSDSAFALMSSVSPEMLERLQGRPQPQTEQSIGDEYDQGTVLKCAIVGWSYSSSPTLEEINNLDARTAAWAFAVAVGLFRRDKAQGESSAVGS